MRTPFQIYLLVSIIFSTLSCGEDRPEGHLQSNFDSEEEEDGLSFRSWSVDQLQRSTLAKVRSERLSLCIEGEVSSADFERAKLWARMAVLTWLRALVLIDERITSKVVFSCSQPDLLFRLRAGSGTSFASPGVVTIFMTRPYGTWTHEVGHALAGLSDTYEGRTAGQCQSGQPESLMCWGAYGPRSNPEQYSSLWDDDLLGIHSNHQKLFGNKLQPPIWAVQIDPFAPFYVDFPWPAGATSPESVSKDLMRVQVIEDGEATPIDRDNLLGSFDR